MSITFQKFFKKIKEDTRNSFDRMIIKKSFNEIMLNDTLHRLFVNRYKSLWQNWVNSQSTENRENVGLFLANKGSSLFIDFMTSNFPYEDDRFILNIKEGGTKWDLVFIIVYRFKANEIEFIQSIIEQIGNTNLDKKIILTRVFAECVLSFSQIISESVGFKYEIMLEEERYLKQTGVKDTGDEMLYLELSARPLE